MLKKKRSAHSLVERKSRQKIQDQFQILKNLIPANIQKDCKKLSILQSAVSYIRELQRIIIEQQILFEQLQQNEKYHWSMQPLNSHIKPFDQQNLHHWTSRGSNDSEQISKQLQSKEKDHPMKIKNLLC
ncbi:hypothetical protein BC833DRAFT_577802 [Globomyces pollinis-pini]|nr:hypothetical protein BC833DRAFT_577802 [Globomyces pollinis-pini]